MNSQVRLAVNLFQVVKRERGYIVELAALFIPNPPIKLVAVAAVTQSQDARYNRYRNS